MSIKKTTRELNYQEKCFNKDRVKFQQTLMNYGHWQCCANCAQNNEGVCKLFNAIPPVEVIAVGCQEYQYEIPF